METAFKMPGKSLGKNILILICISGFVCCGFDCKSQIIYETFYRDSAQVYFANKPDYSLKTFPPEFDSIIQIALMYYPELQHVKIEFRLRKQKAPLSARPSLGAIFRKPKNRKYIVVISRSTNTTLTPILLKNLSYNAQIGVLGHELGHVSEYHSKSGWFFVGLIFRHLSKKSMDKFEYYTDLRCINHGLGFQLLSWSKEVREKLKIQTWNGAKNPTGVKERYMDPSTIERYMKLNPVYLKMKM